MSNRAHQHCAFTKQMPAGLSFQRLQAPQKRRPEAVRFLPAPEILGYSMRLAAMKKASG